jgi:hypothetical protein
MTMDHSRLVHHHSARGDDGRRAREPAPHLHARLEAPPGASEDPPAPASASAAELGLRASAEQSARAPGAVGADARHAPAPGRPHLHRLTGGQGGEDVLAGRPVSRRLVHPPQLRSRADAGAGLTHEGGRRAEPVGPARPSAPGMPPETSVLSLIPLWRRTLRVPFGRPPTARTSCPRRRGGPVPAYRPGKPREPGPGPEFVSGGLTRDVDA